MGDADRLAFAEKLIGKTVAEQTAAGNAEGWISSVMFKTVKTTTDLRSRPAQTQHIPHTRARMCAYVA